MRKGYLITVTIVTLMASFGDTAVKQQDMTFKVIHAPNFNQVDPSNKMAIRIGDTNEIYALDNTKTLDRLVHSGRVPITNNQSYQYVVLNKDNKVIHSEPFYRLHSSSSSSTNNERFEFYGHDNFVPTNLVNNQQQQQPTNQLPTVHYQSSKDDYHYKQGLDRNLVHPNDDIPIFHIQSDPKEISRLHKHVLQDTLIKANITRICKNKLEYFQHAKMELSGKTSRLFKKLSYSVNMDKKESLHGYRKFKLRSCATDPSYLREKLYYDMLYAANAPTARASFIRLFINEEPQGLYLLVDHYKNPFMKNLFGGDLVDYRNGALYQGSMQENPLAIGKLQNGANLAYLGPNTSDYIEASTNASVYKIQEPGHGVEPNDELNELISFIKFIHEMEEQAKDRKKRDEKYLVREWNKRFDVTLFLKHMAFEILMGHNDGYMGAAHNYMLYQDPDQNGRFIWFASDLDQTQGSTLIAHRSTPTNTTMEKLDRFALLDKLHSRPLVKQLFQIDHFKQQFHQILKDLHTSLFKSDIMVNHLTNIAKFIEQDVKWDKELIPFRQDNFKNNQTVYKSMLTEKVLQLPLGPDFIDRMDKIDFITAIQGDIHNHPSIASLMSWFKETNQFLDDFVKSLQ